MTELIYRKELRPALTKGARATDAIFSGPAEGSGSPLGFLVTQPATLDENHSAEVLP